MKARNLGTLYDLETLEWGPVEKALDDGIPQAPDTGGPNRHTCWLATIDEDGSPHVTGIGALWSQGSWWIETGATTRKGRNIARDPRCTLSVATHDFDLVVEARAELITDPMVVAARAKEWAADGWPCEVDESGIALTAPFSAASAGSPPWNVYQLVAESATVLQTVEPGGATRFDF